MRSSTQIRRPHDCLADVCEEWEREATAAEALGLRVVKVRIGIVLGKEGGALEKMLPPFRAFVGGKIASGKQWMSWIHVDDVVGINPSRSPVLRAEYSMDCPIR